MLAELSLRSGQPLCRIHALSVASQQLATGARPGTERVSVQYLPAHSAFSQVPHHEHLEAGCGPGHCMKLS